MELPEGFRMHATLYSELQRRISDIKLSEFDNKETNVFTSFPATCVTNNNMSLFFQEVLVKKSN